MTAMSGEIVVRLSGSLDRERLSAHRAAIVVASVGWLVKERYVGLDHGLIGWRVDRERYVILAFPALHPFLGKQLFEFALVTFLPWQCYGGLKGVAEARGLG